MTSGETLSSAPGFSPGESAAREAAALARNDRYLFEFVEALALCPWARRCRELGRLGRRVLLDSGGPPGSESFAMLVEEAMIRLRALAAAGPLEVEVGLLIFPELAPSLRQGLEGARAFEHVVAALREKMQDEYKGGEIPFFCVAFHPELGMDLADENRAVRFIRRSPDPTIQLVRASVLRDARGSDAGNTRYVDASKLTHEELMAVRRPLSISERIAKLNWETLLREGPERLRAQLAEISKR